MTRHPSITGRIDEIDEVADIAQPCVDVIEVGDVIAIVPSRRGVDRVEPETGDSYTSDVVELGDETAKIADAVSIRVLVGVDLDGSEDRPLYPVRP